MTAPHFDIIAHGPRPVALSSHAVETDGWVILTVQMSTDPAARQAAREPVEEARQHSAVRV